jgi:hypothetical protein
MTRFTTLAAAALLSLAALPALAQGEGTFQPTAVASPAVAQPGASRGVAEFSFTRGPGSDWRGPVASPATGAAQPARMTAGGFNAGLNG